MIATPSNEGTLQEWFTNKTGSDNRRQAATNNVMFHLGTTTIFGDNSVNILLVEDEQAIADTLIYVLTSEGFKVSHVTLGHNALPAHRNKPFDLIILDIGLPDTTGFEVLKNLRAQPEGQMVPVIFLTARAEEIDRILGLELGADDYVVKPFSPREVASRVRAILRRQARTHLNAPAIEENQRWKHDPDAMRIVFHHQALELTRYEYLLLALLLSSPGKVFSREQIMHRVWANALETTDRSIDTHIKTIRAKLRAVSPNEDPILTHRGTGYSVTA